MGAGLVGVLTVFGGRDFTLRGSARFKEIGRPQPAGQLVTSSAFAGARLDWGNYYPAGWGAGGGDARGGESGFSEAIGVNQCALPYGRVVPFSGARFPEFLSSNMNQKPRISRMNTDHSLVIRAHPCSAVRQNGHPLLEWFFIVAPP